MGGCWSSFERSLQLRKLHTFQRSNNAQITTYQELVESYDQDLLENKEEQDSIRSEYLAAKASKANKQDLARYTEAMVRCQSLYKFYLENKEEKKQTLEHLLRFRRTLEDAIKLNPVGGPAALRELERLQATFWSSRDSTVEHITSIVQLNSEVKDSTSEMQAVMRPSVVTISEETQEHKNETQDEAFRIALKSLEAPPVEEVTRLRSLPSPSAPPLPPMKATGRTKVSHTRSTITTTTPNTIPTTTTRPKRQQMEHDHPVLLTS